MTKPKVGVVVGSVREGRFAEKALNWLLKQTEKRDDMEFEVLDLKDFDLPFYNEPFSPSSGKPTQNAVAQKWRDKLSEMDGFVFISPEYNHGPTGVLKNAIDWAWYEWNKKPVAFMGYGNMGASRAIEHLRAIIVELEMVSVRQAIQLGGRDMFAIWSGDATIDDFDYLVDNAEKTFDELAYWLDATSKD